MVVPVVVQQDDEGLVERQDDEELRSGVAGRGEFVGACIKLVK